MATFAEVVTRNTEQDTPSQRETPITPHVPDVQSALYGGAIPDHSQHWADYFQYKRPNPYGVFGNKLSSSITPSPKNVAMEVAEPQHLASGGSSDVWRSFFQTVMGSMRNGHNTGSNLV